MKRVRLKEGSDSGCGNGVMGRGRKGPWSAGNHGHRGGLCLPGQVFVQVEK